KLSPSSTPGTCPGACSTCAGASGHAHAARSVEGPRGAVLVSPLMRDPTAESTIPARSSSVASPEAAARALPSLVLHLSEGFDASTNLTDLSRAAGRHIRKLVDCQTSRIWVTARAGRRLVARDFPGGDGPPTLVRSASDEGLAGWVFSRGEVLRLEPG